MVDNHGTTALHIATSGGNLDIVKRILNLYPDLCYNLNQFHRSALHLAVTNGSLEIIQELLSHRPDSIEILTMDGKNILHLAAESNQLKTVDYLLETVDMLEFLNETDQKGNTPLHLATHAKKSKMVKRLVSVPGVNVNAVNNVGFTPLDIASRITEYYDSPEILEALDEAGGKSGSNVCRNSNCERDYVKCKRYRRYFDRLREGYKNRANMATLVAVLIATVSFTAAFTLPGGFKSDGTATLTGATAFKVFLIFDTLAFFASVIVILAWTTCTTFSTKDLWLLTSVSSIIVCIALIFVTISFLAAMYTVVAPNCRWVAVMVCVVGGGAIVIGTLLFSVVNGYVKENGVRMQRLLGVDFTGEEIKLQRVPRRKCIRRCGSILTRRGSFNDSPYVSTELDFNHS